MPQTKRVREISLKPIAAAALVERLIAFVRRRLLDELHKDQREDCAKDKTADVGEERNSAAVLGVRAERAKAFEKLHDEP